MTMLHVEPRSGRWVVRREGATAPISEHREAGEATLAACRVEAPTRVLVHDRYHRVHAVSSYEHAVHRS
jgi:hypothetical protein